MLTSSNVAEMNLKNKTEVEVSQTTENIDNVAKPAAAAHERFHSDVSVDEDLEQMLWQELQPYQWEKSITRGFFLSLYQATIDEITDITEEFNLECILEVGCGTGQVVGRFALANEDITCIGIDINSKFVEYCASKEEYQGKSQYYVADATKLYDWAKNIQVLMPANRLLFCVNNTMSIMPEAVRKNVVREMQLVAGPKGHVLITYWSGLFFKRGVKEYYGQNQQLCGTFDIDAQDYENRKLLTDTGYTSHWPYAYEVMQMYMGYVEDPRTILSIKQCDKGVFVLLKGVAAAEN